MIGFYNKISNKTIIKCFLKNLYLRQSGHLATIPKILSTRTDRPYETMLWTILDENTDRTIPMWQFEHDIIIPMVDIMLFRLEYKITGCDAIIFHKLPLPENFDSYTESLEDIMARLITTNNLETFPTRTPLTRIDVAFTPVWFKKRKKIRPTIKEYNESLKEYNEEKLNNSIRTILTDFNYGILSPSEIVVKLKKTFSIYFKNKNQ